MTISVTFKYLAILLNRMRDDSKLQIASKCDDPDKIELKFTDKVNK